MKGLVVEDNQDVAYIAAFSLQKMGYDTDTIFDGIKAIEYLEMHAPDVIVLDLQLPGINGQEIIHYIHNQPHLSNMIVIVMTAYEHLAERVKNDVHLVLNKPVRFMKLQVFLQNRASGD
jgi:CheY-like chemotaxis protein